jgi:site-specific DNA-methyltransferase (adenine-specific)
MADNLLYCGNNLDVLRRHIKDESVDLIYLDPPFNSNATYNVLFEDDPFVRSMGLGDLVRIWASTPGDSVDERLRRMFAGTCRAEPSASYQG